MNAQPIRVLVVDDSALMRKLIPQILEADNSIHVVGSHGRQLRTEKN